MFDHTENLMLVAGHRGERTTGAECTLRAFRNALSAGVDMIETDIRLSADGVPVLIHDRTVDRTTDGTGPVRAMTLEQVKSLNANPGGDFEPIPTLGEFLDMVQDRSTLLFNLELKDYTADEGDEWAFAAVDRTIEAVEQYGIRDRCVLNCFEARIHEYIRGRHGARYRLHGFYPIHHMGVCTADPLGYLDCATVLAPPPDPSAGDPGVNRAVAPASYYSILAANGIDGWSGPQARSEEELLAAHARGAKLVTADDPWTTLDILRRNGLHT